MQSFHFVARARFHHRPFLSRKHCANIWARLRGEFSHVKACILMPNHLHMIVPTARPDEVRRQLAIELRSFTRQCMPGERLWEEVPDPREISNRDQLRREIRYVHLNPCRARIARDPLEWEWSTHRDALELVGNPWVRSAELAVDWRVRTREFSDVFHRYVSSDPSVRVEGTASPSQAFPTGLVRLESLIGAATVATRAEGHDSALVRKVSTHLAERLGKPHREELASRLGISRSHAFGLAARGLTADESKAVVAAHRLLGDARLAPDPKLVSRILEGK
jgi:REP element-mobilizing transposase RayT